MKKDRANKESKPVNEYAKEIKKIRFFIVGAIIFFIVLGYLTILLTK